jgi:hypothetical protein
MEPEVPERRRPSGIYLPMRIGLLVLLALCLPACQGGSRSSAAGQAPAAPPSPPAAPEVSWSKDVWPIILVRCQVCHTIGTGAAQVPNMLMSDPQTLYQRWVRILAQCNPDFFRVFPGSSDMSFVIDKISFTAPLCGQRMPPGPPLSDQEQQTFRDWIDQGADNN